MPEPLSYASPTAVDAASPLSIEQMQALAGARKNLRPIDRAVTAAKLDGWSLALFAAITIVFSLNSLSGLLVGAALGVIAAIELGSIRKLRALDPQAARTLALNQLALAAALIVYALWNLARPGDLAQSISSATSGADLEGAGVDLKSIGQTLNTLVYGALIVVAIFAQGSMAWLYARRVKMIRQFVEQTPAWIVQLLQAERA